MNDPASPQFSELVAQDSKDETSIVNDITRVFPTHPFFRQLNGVGQRSLYAVLKAYSNKDPSVGNKGTGYCQGMGFVAGAALLPFVTESQPPSAADEERAFAWLGFMVNGPLAGCYSSGMAGLAAHQQALRELLQRRRPALVAHLDGLGWATG